MMWGESSRFSQGVVKIERGQKAMCVGVNAKFVKHIRPGSDIFRLLDWNEQFSRQFLYDMFTFFLECPLFDCLFVSRLTPWSKQTCTHAT